MRKILTLTTAAMLLGSTASADTFTDSVVQNLRDLGYDFIEVKEGPTQVKFEAIDGAKKLEVVYDRASGKILKQEIESADADEIGRVGLEIDIRDRDFLDDDDSDDDDDDDDRSGHHGGDDDDHHDDDDDHHGSDDDDHDDDDDDNSGHGSNHD